MIKQALIGLAMLVAGCSNTYKQSVSFSPQKISSGDIEETYRPTLMKLENEKESI
ncbi:MAG: hypothetical protein IH823_04315 [Candidatus Dadabacteria bacterium]|nr:hypothetical protein [Candidatus Dadabacteria bacterium]